MIETCQKCGSLRVELVKLRATNGSYHAAYWCRDCNLNARGPGIWISHRLIPNLDDLPLLDDYVKKYSSPCVVCGSREGTELHHFAPRHIFGDFIANLYPQLYLCRAHHDYWHITIAKHTHTDCDYCRRLASQTSAGG